MLLIINGDDYAMSESCTRAIADALRRGLITHTTMMANGVYFEQAAELAHRLNFTDKIGVHLNLTEGEPLTEEIVAVPAFVRDGRFRKDYLKQPRPLTADEQAAVIYELSAQIERIRNAGIPVNHADSHHYIHTSVYLAPLAAQVCRKYRIKRIRLNRTFNTPGRPKITADRIENAWWREQGFVTTDHFGRLSDIADGTVPDNTEIMVHPDYDKDGVLIDRTGFSESTPTGNYLPKIILFSN